MSSPAAPAASLPVPACQCVLVLSLALISIAIVPPTQVIANAVIVSTTSGDCEKPIETWIAVVIALYGAKVVTLAVLGGLTVVQRKVTIASSIVVVAYLGLEVAVVAWSIVGAVWMDESPDCESGNLHADYADSYAMTLATVIISFVATSILLCCASCTFCCIYIGGRLLTPDKPKSASNV